MHGFRLRLATLSILAATACAPRVQAESGPTRPVAFSGVTVVDVESGARRPDQLVVVSGERIAYVGPQRPSRIPAGAQRVDARGKFMIPGLWDMHVHTQEQAEVALLLMLATGVTGARDLHAGVEDAARTSVRLREEVRSGTRPGPRLIVGVNLTGGDDPRPTLVMTRSPDSGRAIVDSLRALGVDLVKVLSLVERDTYFAIADQARRTGLPLDGHVPVTVGVREALGAGQRSIEHVGEGGILFGCTAAEARFHANWVAAFALPRGRQRGERVRQNFVAAGEAFDEPACRSLARELARAGTGWTPTLTAEYVGLAPYAVPEIPESTRPYVTSEYLRFLDDARARPPAPADTAAFLAHLRREMEIVRLMQREGVRLLAGTDVPVKGFSLHDELRLLVRAGLSPLEALRAATLNPAQVLRLPSGVVRRGALADLVLIDGDPTVDIGNAARVRAVVANGRYLDRAALDAMLTRAARLVAEHDARQRTGAPAVPR